jgi:hypothetical protein
MERGSDKHATRLDENMKTETRSMLRGAPVEARVEEAREQEGPGEGEHTPDSRLVGGRVAGDGSQPTDEELEARAEIARHLDPSVFPARTAQLVVNAEENHAPTWIVELLTKLPDDTYDTTEAVWQALGGTAEHRF